MTATAPVKNHPPWKKWMAQGDPPKEFNTVKKMNGRSLRLSSNKMSHHFKEWTTPGDVLKKYILFLQNFVVSNRSSLTVAVPRNYSSAKENQGYKYSKRATLWRKQLFRKSPLQVQTPTIDLLKNLLYLMNSCNYCCEIAN